MLFLTFFGIGLCPKAPGTIASLATIPFLYGAAKLALPVIFFIPIVCLLIIGSGQVAQIHQQRHGVHDPGWIVIDEVIGMIVGFLFYPSASPSALVGLFVFFRFFDIFKIWPVSFFDQKIKHGIGTILDDVMAGIYAGVSNFFIHFCLF